MIKYKMSISPPNNLIVDIDRIKSKLYNYNIDCDSIKYDKVRVDIVSSVDPTKIWDLISSKMVSITWAKAWIRY